MSYLTDIAASVAGVVQSEINVDCTASIAPTVRREDITGVQAWAVGTAIEYGDLGGDQGKHWYEVAVSVAAPLDDPVAMAKVADVSEIVADRFLYRRLPLDPKAVCHTARIEVPNADRYRELRLFVVVVTLRFMVVT